jgi:hypothetical protein
MSAEQPGLRMQLLQLIYASRPFGFDAFALDTILITSRHNNSRNQITGALVCRDDLYLQLLEGPDDAVRSTYDKILRDDRHLEISLISEAHVTERLFPNWDMKHDDVKTWMWTREEVDRDVPKNATRDEALAIFKRLAAESANA